MAKFKTKKKPFIASTLITLVIVVMLIISGPAQAVLVTISGLKDSYVQGESIEFQVQIDINDPDQFVPMKDISLNLTGPVSPSAVFALDGTFLSGDSIISITPVQIPQFPDSGYGYGFGSDFGYGYGYGYSRGDFGYGYGYGYNRDRDRGTSDRGSGRRPSRGDFGYGYGYGFIPGDFGHGYGYGYGQRYDFGYGFGYGYQAGYGYGYGYGGKLTYIYKVTINTATLPAGGYDVVASLNTGKTGKPAFTPDTIHFRSGTAHFTITQAPPVTGGGGGGGDSGNGTGGRGIISSEPLDNIEISETITRDLLSNMMATYRFSIVPMIYEIEVTDSLTEGNIAIRVESLKGPSRRVTVAPEGIVSKNLNILAGTDGITEALVRFKVENSWMNSNGLGSDDVKMVKWDGSNWIQLETAVTSEDDTYTYYEAKTEKFSNFAITGLKGTAGQTPLTTPRATAGVTPAGTTGLIPTVPGAATPVNLALIIVGVVILIAIATGLYMRRR